jgi:uncharacterized protein (TIGR02145 family)
MKNIIIILILTISPILAQCDWNEDNQVDVLDVVATVDCILSDCWSVEPCVDIDGNTYETVQIGDQLWMAENLKVTHYRNGDDIASEGLGTGAYSVFNNALENLDVYGNLYNWYAVDDIRGLAPDGWHIPSNDEWNVLANFIGENPGGVLKAVGTIEAGDGLWYQPNSGAIDLYGFSGLPGGYDLFGWGGSFTGLGSYGYFWTSESGTSNSAWRRLLSHDNSSLSILGGNMATGFSVRCIKDQAEQ